jgi:hypothetical protein
MRKAAQPEPAITLKPGDSITLVLPVIPRTKKNHRQHIKRRTKAGKLITVPIPAAAYKETEAGIVRWAQTTIATGALDRTGKLLRAGKLYLAQPLNCTAIFYRDANRGDAVGYYQGLADALEKAGIVADDKWIVQWDGSRLAKDADWPRIDVVLTAI